MRLREPAAWVALGSLVINLLLAVVGLATFEGPIGSIGWMWSERVANPMYLLGLAVLVSFCVLGERTSHARPLTIISLIVGVIAVLLGLTLALLGIGAAAPILAVLAAIVPQVISIIAVVLLIKLLRLQAVPRRLPPGIGLVTSDSELGNGGRGPVTDSSSAASTAGERLQPNWQPDPAAAAWRTAIDATGQAPATGWRREPTAAWESAPIPTATNGLRPDGPDRIPGDLAAPQSTVPMPQALVVPMPDEQLTVPLPHQQPVGRHGDPSAAHGEWNNMQPLALDWSGHPDINRPEGDFEFQRSQGPS
jgi:hypothetical protein